MANRQLRTPPKFWNGTAENVRKAMLTTVNELQRGKANNTYVLTLTPNATSTVLVNQISTAASMAVVAPKTASAAAALPNLYHSCAKGAVTFTHDANPATDRTFGVAILG